MDSFCSDEEEMSDEIYKKSNEECEVEEVEEEDLEEEEDEEEENKTVQKDSRDQKRKTPTNLQSLLPPSERKIILEFDKTHQKTRKPRLGGSSLSSQPETGIISLESCSTVKSHALSVASKKVERKIIPDQNVMELIENQQLNQEQKIRSAVIQTNPSVSMASAETDRVEDDGAAINGGNRRGLEEEQGTKTQRQEQMDSAVTALRAALVADSHHKLQNQKLSNRAADSKKKTKPDLLFPRPIVPAGAASKGEPSGSRPSHSKPVNLDGSLTDRTLKVVTEKVRLMNSK